MKVILEAQHVCTPKPRGIAYYTIQLIQQLLIRGTNDYGLTFFDGNSERNNKQWISEYFGVFDVPVYECNSLSYRTAAIDNEVYKEKSYNEYTGAIGDVFHFMSILAIPNNLEGKPIVTVHDLIPLYFPELYEGLDAYLYEGFHVGIKRLRDIQPYIITISASAKEDIVHYTAVQPESVFAIHNGYDAKACFPQKDANILQQLGIECPYLLYIGAIDDPRKNVIRILEAFESISNRFPELTLVFAGTTDFNDGNIVSKIDSSKAKSRILRTGYITDIQRRILYSGATAFLFPSLAEGFGTPILEAMACGCPVITSNVSSMPEIAGDAAILIDPYSTEQLAWEMERIVMHEALREELRQKGFMQSAKFAWDKTAEMTEAVYRNAFEDL